MDLAPRTSARAEADLADHPAPCSVGGCARGGVRLRSMDPADLPFVAREHRHYLPDGFFARLGQGFLARYYRPYLSSRHARAYVAEVDGEPAGFLVGVTDPAAHRHHVLRAHGRALLVRGLWALLLRPRLAGLFLRTRVGRYYRRLRPQGHVAGSGGPGARERVAVLADVVVTEPAQSRGIGSTLVERFVEDASAAGCGRVTLVTEAGSSGAGEYYAKRGWEPRGERRSADGRRLATYDRRLRGRPGADRAHPVEPGD